MREPEIILIRVSGPDKPGLMMRAILYEMAAAEAGYRLNAPQLQPA